jgi:hypothetical protein
MKKISLMIALLTATLVACGGGEVGSDPSHTQTTESVRATGPLLTVDMTEGGRVVSTPAGIDCTSSCSSNFVKKTLVSLQATPAAGYSFTGWTGACTGMDCSGKLSASAKVTATFSKNVVLGPGPLLSYTDIVSGSTSGGENNQGTYLSLFGSGFGSAADLGTRTKVYIGGKEVASYRMLGESVVGGKLGLQKLVVQVGNLGLPQGVPAEVRVSVDGVDSNVNNTFMPNPGRIYFVSLSGDDATGVANDITHPYRHLQTVSGGGVHNVLRAGDTVVIRGGNWSDVGMDGAWLRFRYPEQQGSAPKGILGTGWVAFTAYPGEDVHYSTPANNKGGIQGANSAYFGTTGDYVSVSNLRMDVNANATSDAAPINLQYSNGPWRVVNNELGPWPSAINSKAAGVSGHGDGTVVLGNHIHDFACTGAFENHGIYADSGASNWDIGYNWIHDITGGNLIQLYDNVGLAGNNYVGFPRGWLGFTGMLIHHNWMENSGKYGLNLADSILSGQIWNNVVKGSTYSGLRINTISKNMDMTIAFNTFYDNDRVASGSGNGQVLNTWGNYNPTGTIRIYDNIFAAGPLTYKGSDYYVNSGGTDSYLDFKRNLWADNGYGWGKFSKDVQGLYGNPMFTDASGNDFSLSATSPAVDGGTQAVPMTLSDDFTRWLARPQGGADDLGAFERVQ